ncbi:MAG: magnesium and cobalt transport protein CorA [Acidimicrobiales bacterium]
MAGVIVDCAVYANGVRRAGVVDLDHALESVKDPDAFVWIGVFEPEAEEFKAVAKEFYLHELAVEDAIRAHQRPKLEVYGDSLFCVLKTARYLDDTESVEFGELQIFVGHDFVVAVRHGHASPLSEVRRTLEQKPELLRHGPIAVLHAIVDRVVDDYEPVIDGIDNDVSEIEADVFTDENQNPAERIYKLKREVLEFLRHTKPFGDALRRLAMCSVPHSHPELANYFRDVEDHMLRVVSELENLRDLLTDAVNANLAQVGVRQNEDMRQISAWVAIAAVPTVAGAIYGMNFDYMPELDHPLGYPAVIIVTALVCLLLYRKFKSVGWL